MVLPSTLLTSIFLLREVKINPPNITKQTTIKMIQVFLVTNSTPYVIYCKQLYHLRCFCAGQDSGTIRDNMTTFLIIVTFIFGVALLVVAAAQPRRIKTSQFELRRRAERGDASAVDSLRRDMLISDVISLQRITTSLLLVMITILLVSIFNIIVGVLFAVVVALQYGSIARIDFIRAWAQGMYERSEPSILQFIQRYPQIMRLLRNVTPETKNDELLESREQLVYLVSKSDGVLTADEKKLIAHALEFDNLVVSSIMTPVSMIDSISKDELLGPLVLDDLHKTGHSRFPVIDGDIHQIGRAHV